MEQCGKNIDNWRIRVRGYGSFCICLRFFCMFEIIEKNKLLTSTCGQDGITGIRFTFLPQTTAKSAWVYRTKNPGQRRDPYRKELQRSAQGSFLSIQQSTDQHVHMRQLFKVGESNRERVFSSHKGPEVVSVATSQAGKPHDLWSSQQSS